MSADEYEKPSTLGKSGTKNVGSKSTKILDTLKDAANKRIAEETGGLLIVNSNIHAKYAQEGQKVLRKDKLIELARIIKSQSPEARVKRWKDKGVLEELRAICEQLSTTELADESGMIAVPMTLLLGQHLFGLCQDKDLEHQVNKSRGRGFMSYLIKLIKKNLSEVLGRSVDMYLTFEYYIDNEDDWSKRKSLTPRKYDEWTRKYTHNGSIFPHCHGTILLHPEEFKKNKVRKAICKLNSKATPSFQRQQLRFGVGKRKRIAKEVGQLLCDVRWAMYPFKNQGHRSDNWKAFCKGKPRIAEDCRGVTAGINKRASEIYRELRAILNELDLTSIDELEAPKSALAPVEGEIEQSEDMSATLPTTVSPPVMVELDEAEINRLCAEIEKQSYPGKAKKFSCDILKALKMNGDMIREQMSVGKNPFEQYRGNGERIEIMAIASDLILSNSYSKEALAKQFHLDKDGSNTQETATSKARTADHTLKILGII